jgi:hypothetical protein
MRPLLSRVRAPEWAIGASALGLGLSLALEWYGPPDASLDTGAGSALRGPGALAACGFDALPTLRWLVVASSLSGVGTWWLQATRRAPALPVCATVVTWTLSAINGALIAGRVAVGRPASAAPRAGAFVGLAFALALPAAAYRSMRRDGIRPEDGPERIETIALGAAPDGQ